MATSASAPAAAEMSARVRRRSSASSTRSVGNAVSAFSFTSTAAAKTAPAISGCRTATSQSEKTTSTIAHWSAKTRPPKSPSFGAIAIRPAHASPPSGPASRRPSRKAKKAPIASSVTMPRRTPLTVTPKTAPIAWSRT